MIPDPNSNAVFGVILLVIFIFLLVIAASIFCFVFWILMIVDVTQRKFKNETDKVVWILIIILTGIIGALIYYFIVKRKDTSK